MKKPARLHARLALTLVTAGLSAASAEPTVVTLGKGTYASEPPNQSPQQVAFLNGPDRLDPSLGKVAYPSNNIWAFGIWSNEKDKLAFGRPYLMPIAVTADANGFGIYLTNEANDTLGKAALGAPLTVTPIDASGAAVVLPAGSQRLLRIGDWSRAFRFHADAQRTVDLSTVRGVPIVWLEPEKSLGLKIPVAAGAKVTALDGGALPAAGAANVLVTVGERRFALYAGGSGKITVGADALTVSPGAALAVATPLKDHDPAAWRSAAMAVPRDTRVSWTYNRAAGTIDTVWTIKTDKLAPDAGQPLQGFLPHCWRHAMDPKTSFLAGNYVCPRGLIKLARGDSFKMSWRVTGLLPSMPVPPTAGTDAPYQPEHFNKLLADFTAKYTGTGPDGKSQLAYGDDTYFGGKDLLKYAQTAAAAHFSNSPSRAALVEAARTVLADWFTWTPGEKAHYFARYEKIGGFVGFKASFNANEFRDTHFHCGYFTISSAILASADPAFAKDYGEIATLVAKQYANWDRADTRFPFMRTFDFWTGHSYASAKGGADGGSFNQESSSEAMNAWAGVGLLGSALGNADMEATGLMGYAIEGEAIKEYWNNYYSWKAERQKPGSGAAISNWSAGYTQANTIVGIVLEGGNKYGTFFSGNPYHIYGIQWLPMSPALQYVSYGDFDFGLYQYEQLKKRQVGKIPGFDLETLNTKDLLNWSNVFAGYLAIVDPEKTAARWETLKQADSPIIHEPKNVISYYLIHAYRAVGILDIDAWADQGTASVYKQRDGKRTLVAWNPGSKPLTVTARDAGGVIGSATVAPGGLVRVALKPRTN